MTATDDQISAYLDGELPADQARALTDRLASEPELRRRLDAMRAADAFAARRMAMMLDEPVPLALARAIAAPPVRTPVRLRTARIALAGAVAGALVAGLGVMALLPVAPPPPSWTDEIAAYHRVYATEDRHLVEVGAEESDHIRVWLGGRIGRAFDIPDLSDHGLAFRGARLLVAAGAPVAQLVYTLSDGSVFALCLTPRAGQPDLAPRAARLAEFDGVIWRDTGTGIVLVGPMNRLDLLSVSQSAAQRL